MSGVAGSSVRREPGCVSPQGEQKSGARGLASLNSTNGSEPDPVEGSGENGAAYEKWHPLNPYQVRLDLPDLLSKPMF